MMWNKKIKAFVSKRLILYALLILLVLGPLLSFGYIQSFDMPWGPHVLVPSVSSNDWLLYAIIKFLSSVVGSQLIQKMILASIFLIAALGTVRVVNESSYTSNRGSAAYLAGILYIFNPFGIYAPFSRTVARPAFVCMLSMGNPKFC